MNNKKIKDLTKMALVAALYVVISLVFAGLSYGSIQFRISEMLCFLVLLDKRYIYAITLGCGITNMFSTLGPIDLIVGTLSTFLALEIIYHITKNMSNLILKLITVVVALVLFMIPISLELYYILHVPFWLTLMQTMIGEFTVTAVGAIIFYYFIKVRRGAK